MKLSPRHYLLAWYFQQLNVDYHNLPLPPKKGKWYLCDAERVLLNAREQWANVFHVVSILLKELCPYNQLCRWIFRSFHSFVTLEMLIIELWAHQVKTGQNQG